jgi:hypothetical protein
VALVAVVRVVAGAGSAAVWVGGTMVGVIAALVIFLGVVLVWALMAKDEKEQRYRLLLLDKFQSFLLDLSRILLDLLRGRGKK